MQLPSLQSTRGFGDIARGGLLAMSKSRWKPLQGVF